MGSVLLFADDSIAVVVVTLELARKLLHTSPVKVAMVVWRATTHSTLKPTTQKGRAVVCMLLLQWWWQYWEQLLVSAYHFEQGGHGIFWAVLQWTEEHS